MSIDEVKETIEAAIGFTGFRDPRVVHRPRLLSDNGLCYVSKALKEYLEQEGIAHTRCRPYHPMTQGKIERYHHSMKNIGRTCDICNGVQLSKFLRYVKLTSKDNPLIMKTGLRPHNKICCISTYF